MTEEVERLITELQKQLGIVEESLIDADKLIRSQAEKIEKLRNANAAIARQHVEQTEQIAALDLECHRLGIEEAKLQARVETLTSERDALAVAIGKARAAIEINMRGEVGKPLLALIADPATILKAHDAALVAEKDAEILRLENSILEADDYRTETGERDTIRAYRQINAEAAGIREGRIGYALEKKQIEKPAIATGSLGERDRTGVDN